MVTWTIEALEYTNENTDYPKLVKFMWVRGEHSDGPVHHYAFVVPPPIPGEPYIPYEDLTKTWAYEVFEAYADKPDGLLNDFAAETRRGFGLPWTD